MKMAIVVRKDIGMTVGKMAGQVGHAVCRLVWDRHLLSDYHQHLLESWYGDLEKKVILKVNSEAELRSVETMAKGSGIRTVEVHDAGLTQLEPNTFTCIGIGPDDDAKIDAITKGLKLY